jgi:hypothetical protein
MEEHGDIMLKYAPRIYFDEAEPFSLAGIGATIFTSCGVSPSFQREIVLKKEAALAIEYAYFWDYDIEHLYDLEHIWIYVNAQGRVIDAEASFHGRYFKVFLPFVHPALEETHLNIYCQPGKHAFLPQGEWFQLLPNLISCCGESAGSAGLLVNDMFADLLPKDKETDEAVMRYIKARFSFVPSLRFVPTIPDSSLYMPWAELFPLIPRRIKAQLDIIL